MKKEIIAVLEENMGEYVSGEELAVRLNVSRNTVWRNIRALRREGYEIDAATNRGYCLVKGDILSEHAIKKNLKNSFLIRVEKTVTSTNKMLKEAALVGAPEGSVLVAEEQTEGRGRLGRSFFSPARTGIYMSVLLRPELCAKDALLITTAAAVAVCRGLESEGAENVQIKWVNDVFCKGRKVCGILTEAGFNMESGNLDFAILGIGINVSTTDFPPELRDTASAAFDGDGVSRNRIVAAVLDSFWELYKNLGKKEFLEEYKSRSFLYGRRVTVLSPDGEKTATVLEIDDECRLLVEYENGERVHLSTGEISVKIQEKNE